MVVEGNSAVAHLLANRLVVTGNRVAYERESLSSGIQPVDGFLPFKGFQRGGISELVGHDFKHFVAAAALAANSRGGMVAYLSPVGVPGPELMAALGADHDHCFFLVHPGPSSLLKAAEMILSSGLFHLVALHASSYEDGRLLLDPPGYRRLLGQAVRHHAVLLLLLDEHPELPLVARPSALRLRFDQRLRQGLPASRRTRSGKGTATQVGQIEITLQKCAGFPPGATLRLEV